MAVNPIWTKVKIKVRLVTERIGDCSQRQVVGFVISWIVPFLVRTRHFGNVV